VLPPPASLAKIARLEDAVARFAALPRPRVLTNGVFDILHRGQDT
jgi:bifunctional ADP-heptose synthase (sugar kinase/adenylyltransferase)